MKLSQVTMFLLALLAVPRAASAQDANVRMQDWPAEVLDLAERLAIQDGGRVKPLHTFAGFTLLRMHGKRSIVPPYDEDARLTPVEWLLDVLFFPTAAADYPLFQVRNAEVVEAIGVSHEGKEKSDHYSLNELREGVPRLFQLANEYAAIEEKDRSTVQQQLFLLATNVDSYLQLSAHMQFARKPIPVGGSDRLNEVFGGRTEVHLGDVLAQIGPLRAMYDELAPRQNPASGGDDGAEDFHALAELLTRASELTSGTESMALFPPAVGVDVTEEWMSPAGLFTQAFQTGAVDGRHLRMMGALESAAEDRNDTSVLAESMATLHDSQAALGSARGEVAKVDLEVAYYKAKLLDYAQYAFVLSFLLLAFMWLRPRNRWLYRSTNVATVAGTALVTAAIVVRCIIRARPPVSTLYETVLFVVATGATVALVVELIGRRRIAVSAAAVLGTIGLFIANGYEMLDKRDTMPSLVAVLDTNFWLATHVTSIVIGYSAGMLASLIASFYLVSKLVGWKRGDRAFYRSMGRMVYGVLCFGLIFSTVGTILGGIWANDSWGRFWGWDPKENGALLICLSQIAILHARMGGLIREHGVCMAAAFSGTIIGFSWWGVNLLGVGLHSYGFTSGIHSALWTYYGIQWGIVGLGAIAGWRERALASAVRSAAAKGAVTEARERDNAALRPGESTA